jgi:hypothetical protein
MTDINWYEHEQYIPDKVKKLDEAQAAYALREAWKRVYGDYPSDRSLAVLWAKSALETGRWKFIHNYNFGNIKKKRKTRYSPDDGHFFTMFRCGEVINGRHIMFDPPHYQTHFRAYLTVEEGAEDYLRFVSQKKRYLKAWQKVIEGDPRGYSHELKVAGYYTASEARYTAGVVRLFDEFLRRKEELMSWVPEQDHDTDPAPPPVMLEEPEEDIHDTDHDVEPPAPEIPEPPADPPRKALAGMAIAVAIIGSALMWLFQGCL